MEKQTSNTKMIIIAVTVVLSVLIIAVAAITALQIVNKPAGSAPAQEAEAIPTQTAAPTVDPNIEIYQKATVLYQKQKYAKAAKLFDQLGSYQDAADKADICKYKRALALYGKKKYTASLKVLREVKGMPKAKALKMKCKTAKKNIKRYQKAKVKYNDGKFTQAINILNKVKNYAPAKKLKRKAIQKKQNMPPARPDVNEFVDVTPPVGDGTTYQVTWGAVPGASGYQYYCTQKVNYSDGSIDEEPYYEQNYTMSRKYEVAASDSMIVTFKVRAYKLINGSRKYGDWSREVHCYMNNW